LAIVWSIGRIAWSVIRSIVWSVVYRIRRVGWGVSVGVSWVVWCWGRGGGSRRESRNTTSVEGGIKHLFNRTLADNARAETRTNGNATIFGVQANY
jgi:hypothetical protein